MRRPFSIRNSWKQLAGSPVGRWYSGSEDEAIAEGWKEEEMMRAVTGRIELGAPGQVCSAVHNTAAVCLSVRLVSHSVSQSAVRPHSRSLAVKWRWLLLAVIKLSRSWWVQYRRLSVFLLWPQAALQPILGVVMGHWPVVARIDQRHTADGAMRVFA